MAYVERTGATLLIGGVPRTRSTRCGTRETAQELLDLSLAANRGAGKECQGRVIESTVWPEIFVHCGIDLGAVGSRCPGCGQSLTRRDAEAYAAVRLAREVR